MKVDVTKIREWYTIKKNELNGNWMLYCKYTVKSECFAGNLRLMKKLKIVLEDKIQSEIDRGLLAGHKKMQELTLIN